MAQKGALGGHVRQAIISLAQPFGLFISRLLAPFCMVVPFLSPITEYFLGAKIDAEAAP